VRVSIGWLGAQADTSIRAIIGLNFTIRMVFKTEGVYSGIPYNVSIRIRVFDEGDTLIGATTLFSDGGTLVPSSNSGFFADGTKLLGQAVPAGTRTLEYSDLAGLFGYVEPSTGGASVRSATLFSPDHGIWGRSTHSGSYSGSWIVMVDMVNWYLPNSSYPPVPALLQGESPFFFPYNHLGPYQQSTYSKIPTAQQGSEASVEFELDLRGYVQGTVLGFDWNDAVRTISWATIAIKSSSTTYYWYTWDGWFDGYLDPGEYETAITEWTTRGEGHTPLALNLTVSAGQTNRAAVVTLEESKMAIPEFSSVLSIDSLTMALALAILAFLRRKKPSG
jgi:hypothetical protein